jgi:hypothetical protein
VSELFAHMGKLHPRSGRRKTLALTHYVCDGIQIDQKELGASLMDIGLKLSAAQLKCMVAVVAVCALENQVLSTLLLLMLNWRYLSL